MLNERKCTSHAVQIYDLLNLVYTIMCGSVAHHDDSNKPVYLYHTSLYVFLDEVKSTLEVIWCSSASSPSAFVTTQSATSESAMTRN
jgi:hypothetical protein